jgi:hypothetical protein
LRNSGSFLQIPQIPAGILRIPWILAGISEGMKSIDSKSGSSKFTTAVAPPKLVDHILILATFSFIEEYTSLEKRTTRSSKEISVNILLTLSL